MSSARAARTARVLASLALGAALIVVAARTLERAEIAPADFTFVNGAEPSSLDPQAVTGIAEGRVMRALYEGLVVQDPKTLAPLPGMAEAWDVTADGLTWTFHVRAGSLWTDGTEVTAFDFAWSFQRLLDPRTAADYADLLWCVRGAKAWAANVDPNGAPRAGFDTVGIRALDDRTLVVELERPVDHFLEIAAFFPLFPVSRRALEEAERQFQGTWRTEWQKPGHLVTNGPYRLVERRIDDRLRLVKNEGYWDRDHVAFKTIDVLASAQLTTNLNLYLTGAAGYLAQASPGSIPRLRGREDFQPEPYLASSFLRVNVTKPPLDDKRVRRALALAIDRAAICEKVTRGGETASFSLVPHCLPDWTGVEMRHASGASATTRFATDCVEARDLMTASGFGPSGTAPPEIEIHYATQSSNREIAEVLADTWRRELGVRVRFKNQEFKSYLATQREVGYDVSRSSWIADYADPSTFLDVFAGDSPNNRTGWFDARYDALLARARTARGAERSTALEQAEALLLEELPILPLYTFAATNLVAPRLGGFYPNALDQHAPKFWYWMDDEELARRRALLTSGTLVVASQGPGEGLYPPAHPKYRPRSSAQ